MRHIPKRLGGLLLAAVFMLSMLPAGAAAEAPVADEPERGILTEEAGIGEETVWEAIGALEKAALPAKPSQADYEALLPRIEALVTARDDYAPGSAVYQNGALLWQTSDGNACGYDPYIQFAVNGAVPMTEEERAAAERSLPAQAAGEETAALMAADSYARDVALFIPWWGVDTIFSLNLYYTGLELVEATGGECRVYMGSEATIDSIADALTSCCAVFINTHGSPGVITLTTAEGITAEDRAGHHGYESLGYTVADGQCIVNHLRGRSVAAEFVSLNACLCMGSDGLANPLAEAGVDVVFGWTQPATIGPNERFTHYFVEGMIQGMTAAEGSIYTKRQMCRWVLDNHMTSKENVIAMLEETGMWYWNNWENDAVTAEEARAQGAAFPIFVSEQDPYPGEDHVDEIQTVKSTWKLTKDPLSQKNIRVWGKTGAFFVATLPDAFKENIVTSTGDAFKENAVYSITLTGGQLPPGVSIKPYYDPKYYDFGSAEPVTVPCLYGTPTEPGLYEAQLLVELENGKKDSRTATIVIVSEPFAQTEQSVVAEPGKEKTVNFTDNHTGAVFKAELKSGWVPPGMAFLTSGGKLRYCGAPSQPGMFTAVWRIIMTSGEAVEHTITVTVPSTYKEASESSSFRKGTQVTAFFTFDGVDQVGCAEQISGQLPPGMTFDCSMSEKPSYMGKPTSNGTWKAVFRFMLQDGTILTHTVTALVYSDTPSLDVYTMDLSLGETIVSQADQNTWLNRAITCAANPGKQVDMKIDPSTGEVRLDLDQDGTWDVSVTRRGVSAVYTLLPGSSLTGDDYTLTLNQAARDRADAWGTEDPGAQYARAIHFHLHTEYDLSVTGIRVNSRNLKDIRGDGKFSFDGVDTLIVRGDCSCYASLPAIRNEINGLTVLIDEDSVLESWSNCIETKGSLSLTGPGKLILKSKDGSGIVCENTLLTGGPLTAVSESRFGVGINFGEDACLVVSDADLTVQGTRFCIKGTSGSRGLVVRGSDVTASGATAAIQVPGGLELTQCIMKAPEGGSVRSSDGRVVDSAGEAAKEVTIQSFYAWPLYICGEQVTELNREDILKDGVFSFDGDRTLTVSGSCTYGGYIIQNSGVKHLTIAIAKDSVLDNGISGWARPILLSSSTTITGPGKLTLRGPDFASGLDAEGANLTLRDLDLTVIGGEWGAIMGGGDMFVNKLTIENSSVTADGGNDYYSAINSFAGGIELVGCEIVSPSDAVVKGGRVVHADDTLCSDVLIQATMSMEVSGSELNYSLKLTAGSAMLVAAWYDGEGRMLGSSVQNVTLDGPTVGTRTVKKDQKEYRLFVLDKNGVPVTAVISINQ